MSGILTDPGPADPENLLLWRREQLRKLDAINPPGPWRKILQSQILRLEDRVAREKQKRYEYSLTAGAQRLKTGARAGLRALVNTISLHTIGRYGDADWHRRLARAREREAALAYKRRKQKVPL